MIESYSFGRMNVQGHLYKSDLIIYPERIYHPWWRKSGHLISPEDLIDIFNDPPEILVIGTGFFGRVKVHEDVYLKARELDITLLVEKSGEAVKSFNRNTEANRTVGGFHLTC